MEYNSDISVILGWCFFYASYTDSENFCSLEFTKIAAKQLAVSGEMHFIFPLCADRSNSILPARNARFD